MKPDRQRQFALDDPAFRAVRLLTARQVAALLAVDQATIWRWTSRVQGSLRCVRFGRRCSRFLLRDVQEFIEGNGGAGP